MLIFFLFTYQNKKIKNNSTNKTKKIAKKTDILIFKISQQNLHMESFVRCFKKSKWNLSQQEIFEMSINSLE